MEVLYCTAALAWNTSTVDFGHGCDRSVEDRAATSGLLTGGKGELLSRLGVVRCGFYRDRHLFHARGSLLEDRRLLAGALAQVGVARRDFLCGRVDFPDRLLDPGNQLHFRLDQGVDTCRQRLDLAAAQTLPQSALSRSRSTVGRERSGASQLLSY